MTEANKHRQKVQKLRRFIATAAIGLSVIIGMQLYSQSLFGAERAPAANSIQDLTPTLIPPATPTNTPQPSAPTPESLPLPTPSPTKPNWWIRSDDGGRLNFGLITAILPPGFTNQGGASVFGDPISRAEEIVISDNLIVGTLFTFGIWPTTDQIDYQRPIEFRITLDAAQVAGIENQLIVQMYNPSLDRWVPVSAQFRPGSYQMVAQIQSFTPVAKDFPAWGGRSYIGVFKQGAPTTPLSTDTPQPVSGPVANRNANLRTGPGTNYPVMGGVRAGDPVAPVAKLANGSWYLLANSSWIAAFLVDSVPQLPTVESTPPPPTASTATPIVTRSRTPTPQRTPTKTPTPIATS